MDRMDHVISSFLTLAREARAAVEKGHLEGKEIIYLCTVEVLDLQDLTDKHHAWEQNGEDQGKGRALLKETGDHIRSLEGLMAKIHALKESINRGEQEQK